MFKWMLRILGFVIARKLVSSAVSSPKGRYEMAERRHGGGSVGSFLAGAVIGGLVGAGIALLQAPQSGERTREQIKHQADETRKQVENLISTAKTHTQEAAEEVGKHVQEIKTEGQQAVEKIKTEGKAAVEETQEHVQEGIEEAKRQTGTTTY